MKTLSYRVLAILSYSKNHGRSVRGIYNYLSRRSTNTQITPSSIRRILCRLKSQGLVVDKEMLSASPLYPRNTKATKIWEPTQKGRLLLESNLLETLVRDRKIADSLLSSSARRQMRDLEKEGIVNLEKEGGNWLWELSDAGLSKMVYGVGIN